MDTKAYFDAAMQIVNLANNIINLISRGADLDIAQAHFESISRIAAENATKPEIQAYSAHGVMGGNDD